MNVVVTWSRDEVLVSIYNCSVYSTCASNLLAVLVHQPERGVSAEFVSV